MRKVIALALILVGLAWLVPVYLTAQTSFMSTFASPVKLWGHAHLENWRALPWNTLGRWAFHSLVVCGITSCLCPLICISAGYAFVRYEFPGKDQIFFAFLLAIAMPGMILFLPRYLIVAKMGLTNSYLGLILPILMSPTLVFLARQYLCRIDIGIIEAARLDGGSELRILWSIILPLCVPLIVLGAVNGFTAGYGDFMWQYLVAPEVKTLTVGTGLFLLSTDASIEMLGSHLLSGRKAISVESLRAAVSVLQGLPLLIVFILGQRHFLKGLKVGMAD